MSADELVAAPELKAAASEATVATTPLLLPFFLLTSNIGTEDIAPPPPAKYTSGAGERNLCERHTTQAGTHSPLRAHLSFPSKVLIVQRGGLSPKDW